MRTRLLLALGSLLASTAQAAVTVPVTITAPGDHGYELRAGGAQKVGHLPPQPGYVTVSDAIVVASPAATIPVTLKFYDMDGLVSTCPLIEVFVSGGRPSCRPTFTLTTTQLSYRNLLCELTCPPSGRQP